MGSPPLLARIAKWGSCRHARYAACFASPCPHPHLAANTHIDLAVLSLPFATLANYLSTESSALSSLHTFVPAQVISSNKQCNYRMSAIVHQSMVAADWASPVLGCSTESHLAFLSTP